MMLKPVENSFISFIYKAFIFNIPVENYQSYPQFIHNLMWITSLLFR